MTNKYETYYIVYDKHHTPRVSLSETKPLLPDHKKFVEVQAVKDALEFIKETKGLRPDSLIQKLEKAIEEN